LSFTSRAWYAESVHEFCRADVATIIGHLVQRAEKSATREEVDAWRREIEILKGSLADRNGEVILEYAIPRVGGRVDAVHVSERAVFVIEFKVGATTFTANDREQVWDYALDLKNFHDASHTISVAPLLVATEAASTIDTPIQDSDGAFRPINVTPDRLREAIESIEAQPTGRPVKVREWASSPYRPTPTIVEAAKALYAQHSVVEIARSDADAMNLGVTSDRLEQLIERARSGHEKLICFVTGVPGAGKTLVGLNVATRHREGQADPAVFLSGNGPLVRVLRAALVRDETQRRKLTRGSRERSETATRVKAFIQNVHHFRDEALASAAPPAEHIAVFDEAQRAWTREQTANFMRRRKKVPHFQYSEPEFLLRYMERHKDWAAVVCLVGGGQEINTGEAGISAWLAAVRDQLPEWRVVVSERLADSEYDGGSLTSTIRELAHVEDDPRLHLSVSMRSFRAERVSAFVKAVLDCDSTKATGLLDSLRDRYPIALTRDLRIAKDWLRNKARGTERAGIVASSKALRLKAQCLDVRVDVDPVHWFLNGREDVRSSHFLEDVATEFQVQGLELDWACVAWDADLRRTEPGWGHHDFRGAAWNRINKPANQRYLLNAYRVLLTRARQGMVMFVPKGAARDKTRLPSYYDATFDYLKGVGMQVL